MNGDVKTINVYETQALLNEDKFSTYCTELGFDLGFDSDNLLDGQN